MKIKELLKLLGILKKMDDPLNLLCSWR